MNLTAHSDKERKRSHVIFKPSRFSSLALLLASCCSDSTHALPDSVQSLRLFNTSLVGEVQEKQLRQAFAERDLHADQTLEITAEDAQAAPASQQMTRPATSKSDQAQPVVEPKEHPKAARSQPKQHSNPSPPLPSQSAAKLEVHAKPPPTAAPAPVPRPTPMATANVLTNVAEETKEPSPSPPPAASLDPIDIAGEDEVAKDTAGPSSVPQAIFISDRPDIQNYTAKFYQWLAVNDNQAWIAAIAFCIGLIGLWNGPVVWFALFTTAVGGVGAAIVYHEAKSFGLAGSSLARCVLGAEAAVVIAYSVHTGFESSQVLFGVALGFRGAYELSALADELSTAYESLAILWYTVGSLLGWLFFTSWRRPVLASVPPLFGAHLVTISLGFLFAHSRVSDTAGDLLPATREAWIDASFSLLGSNPAASAAVQLGFALLGALIFAINSSVAASVGASSLGIVGAIFFSAAGGDCDPALGCPHEIRFQWLLVGTLLKLAIAAAAIYRQLSILRLEGFICWPRRSLFEPEHGPYGYNAYSRDLGIWDGYTKLEAPRRSPDGYQHSPGLHDSSGDRRMMQESQLFATSSFPSQFSSMANSTGAASSNVFQFTQSNGETITLTKERNSVTVNSSKRGKLGTWKSFDEHTCKYVATNGNRTAEGDVPRQSLHGLMMFLADVMFHFVDTSGETVTLTKDSRDQVIVSCGRRGNLGVWKSFDERTYKYRAGNATGEVPQHSVDGLVAFLSGSPGASQHQLGSAW